MIITDMRRTMVRVMAGAVALTLGVASPAFAKEGVPAAAAMRIPFERYVLPNGLEVILARNPRLPRVTVNLRYKVGSWSDAPGRAGSAHLFEHLYAFSRLAVSKVRLEEVGATQVGATTEFDRTTYYTTVPAAQLDAVLSIESERMATIGKLINPKLLTREAAAVRNERRLVVENRPYSMADEAIFRGLFPKGHPYDHLYVGLHPDVQAITLDEARRFFATYYTPNNAVLTIAGDFRPEDAKRLVQAHFGGMARGPVVTAPAGSTVEPVAHRETVTDRISRSRLSFAWRSPGNYRPGSAEADMLAIVLGSGGSSRLYRRLVLEDRLAQNVTAYNYAFWLGSAFILNVTAAEGADAQRIERIVDEEVARLLRDGPTEAEVVRARNTMEMRIIRGLEHNGDIIDRSGLTIDPPYGGTSEQLSECSHLTGNPDCVPAQVAAYRRATPASMRKAAAALFTDRRILVAAVPGDRVVNDPPLSAAAQAEADSAEADDAPAAPVTEKDAKAAPASSPARIPLPLPIVSRLPNGLTIYHLQEKNAYAGTALLVVKGGTGLAPQPGMAAFLMDMLTQGTRRRSSAQITQDAAQLGATLDTDLDGDAMALRMSVQRSNFPAALDLLSDVARFPTLSQAAIDTVRDTRRDRIAQIQAAADPSASLALTTALYGADHPMGSGGLFNDVLFARQHPYGYEDLGTVESLKTIGRPDLAALHDAAFSPGNSALIVSGDFDEAELGKLVARYFGDWRGQPVGRRAAPAPQPAASRLIRKEAGPSSQTIIRVGGPASRRNDPGALSLRLMNIVFGEVYASRITANLREKNRFTYMARSRVALGRDGGVFALGSSVKAESAGAAVGEIFKEIDRLRGDLVQPEELQFARSYFDNSMLDQFETSTAAVTSLSDLFVYGLPDDYFAGLSARAEQVTRETIRDSARRYLVPSNMVVVAVGPADSVKGVRLPSLPSGQ